MAPATETLDPQLVDVLDAHRFDEHALQVWLHENLHGVGHCQRIQQFQGGQSNPTFLLETDTGSYVLRKKPPGQTLPSAHRVEREYRVIRALFERTRVPVPRAWGLCENPTVIGTPFYVMDFMPGRVVSHPTLRELEYGERRSVHDAAIDTLAQLHAVDIEQVGLEDFGKPDGYVARQVQRWSKQYQASKTEEMPAMDRLMAWLPDHLPATDECAIAHGDYRVGNLMLAPDRPEVTAILDWELATLGHPLADLAYYCLPHHLPMELEGARGLIGENLEALNLPTEQQLIERYCRQSGREQIEDWHVFIAFSLFRLAAILQGVYARALQGNASNADALEVGKRASALAEAGWRVAQNGAGGGAA